jgi:hypothetical protein
MQEVASSILVSSTPGDADAGRRGLVAVGIDFPLHRGRPSVVAAAGHGANILIWGVLAIGVTIGLVVRVLHRMRD